MKPLVSIIIPVYKVEDYLSRCMDSILNQTYNNLEIILVDDESPDNCPQLCDEYAKKDARVKVIHKKNGGLSDARNAALEFITGKYCFFVDSDDFIQQNTIAYLVELAEKHQAEIVQCDRELGYNSKFTKEANYTEDNLTIYNNITIFESSDNKVTIWAKLYLSTLWDGIKMPVGKLNEDDYTTWKLYYKARVIIVTHCQLYYNYINPDGICSNLKKSPNIDYPMEAYHERINYFERLSERHLSDLSKWRYIKYILLSVRNPKLTPEQRNILIKEFAMNYKRVLACSSVPLSNKIIILIFRISPKISTTLLNIKGIL